MTTAPDLTVQQHMILDVERGYWHHAGAKEAHVMDVLGMSMTIYSLKLLRLIETDQAERVDPLLVRRLRRLRDDRARQRSAVRLGITL